MSGPTHVIQLTGQGRGAVATVAIHGPLALRMLAQFFHPKRALDPSNLELNRVTFGTWKSQDAEEELVVCRTDADTVEVHCHGGRLAVRGVIDALLGAGATEISVEHWLSLQELDPQVLEARRRLPLATTERTLTILMHQARGAMRRFSDDVIHLIKTEQTQDAVQQLQRCLELQELGKHLTEPWRVVLIGPPNTGKSSLINAMLGYERALVFDQPGTTRDTVNALTAIDGWPIEITDTAGLRDSSDVVEAEGVRRAKQSLEHADLVLAIHDLTRPSSETTTCPTDTPLLRVGTKSDQSDATLHACDAVTSAHAGSGIEDLLHRVTSVLIPNPPRPREAVPLTPAVCARLTECIRLIESGQLEEACARLR